MARKHEAALNKHAKEVAKMTANLAEAQSGIVVEKKKIDFLVNGHRFSMDNSKLKHGSIVVKK